MTDDRWPRVKALFQATVERPSAERDAFLADATGGDDALRRRSRVLCWRPTRQTERVLDRLPIAARPAAGRWTGCRHSSPAQTYTPT